MQEPQDLEEQPQGTMILNLLALPVSRNLTSYRDAFTKREKANEDMYVREQEKQK